MIPHRGVYRKFCHTMVRLPRAAAPPFPDNPAHGTNTPTCQPPDGKNNMDLIAENTYRVVMRFPWGERRDVGELAVTRDPDGTVRWACEDPGVLEPYCDVVRETDHWIMGWVGGTCDTTVVISVRGEDAPDP